MFHFEIFMILYCKIIAIIISKLSLLTYKLVYKSHIHSDMTTCVDLQIHYESYFPVDKLHSLLGYGLGLGAS